MNVKDLVGWTDKLAAAPDSDLLALRLIMDEPDPVASIEQDLRDLHIYPERLSESYRKEWVAYINQALHRELSSEQIQDDEVFAAYLQTRLHEREAWVKRTLALGEEMINNTKAVQDADNVTTLPNAHRQAVEKMIE